MKERVQIGVDQLKEEMESTGKMPEGESRPPSQAAQQITKQLRILTQVLSPILHEEQMHKICSSVAQIFTQELGNAFQEMIDALDLRSVPQPESVASDESDDCAHPLGEASSPGSKAAEALKRAWQRDQVTADCLHLIETLSQLPTGDQGSQLLQPLHKITQSLI